MELLPPVLSANDTYIRFAGATATALPRYRAIMRGRMPGLEVNAAERFARNWMALHLVRAEGDTAWRDVLTGATADDGLNGFGLVVAALLGIQLARYAEAAELAERAYAADQHETFAQRLFLAAGEYSQSLRLAVDEWLEDRFCPNPFTDVEVIGSGDIYTCCAAWLPVAIGSARDADRPDYWNGDRAAELRRSVLDGDFGYCSRLSCPRITARSLPRKVDVSDPVLRAAIDQPEAAVPPPQRVLLSYDTSCNLSCPSCRTELISSGQKAARDLDGFYDDRIAPLAIAATRIKVTGSGDPFGSRHFRHVLARLTDTPSNAPRLQLHTNGVLFDQHAWDTLRLEGHVRSVWVSVDAAEPDTYAVLRRGGNFTRLLRNLEFLGRLRAEQRIGQLRLDFVVQAENFRQMPDFVDLARRVGADGVHFLMLRNWGTFSPEVFRAKAVAFETHPEFPELLAILADDRFGAPEVDLGNLYPLRQRALRRGLRRAAPAPARHAKPEARAIVFLGIPRTGTNYLFQCLRGFDQLMVLSEVFNPRAAYGFDHYGAVLRRHFGTIVQRDFRDQTDHRLVRHIATYPGDTVAQITALAARSGFAAVAMKLFPNQLSFEALQQDVLLNPQIVKVFVGRPMLECYISYRKAQLTERWRDIDTTDCKVDLALDEYRTWLVATQAWYDSLQRQLIATGQHFGWLDYTTFTDCPPETALAAVIAELRPFNLGLSLARTPTPTLVRQDRNEDVFGRIADGAGFRSAVTAAGLLAVSLKSPQRNLR